jgi:hypothetical protein
MKGYFPDVFTCCELMFSAVASDIKTRNHIISLRHQGAIVRSLDGVLRLFRGDCNEFVEFVQIT